VLRVVLDTGVLVAAFTSASGASRQLLLDGLDGRFQLLISTSLIIEYEAVLTRPEHLKRAGLSDRAVIEVLDELAGVCAPVAFDYRWRPTGAHEDDELVIETAISGRADVVATFNLRHMQAAALRFGFIAQRPGPLLKRMRA
jgi:putative PIN family toxin of toxin-antitoxin system